MYPSYDVCDVESWTRQAVVPGPKRVAIQCAATSLIAFIAAMVVAGSCIGVDPFDAADRGEGAPGSGIIVDSEAMHVWIPEPLALLASLEGRREVLKDHESLRRFLAREDRTTLGFAVTYRGHRVDGLWTDATFVRRPFDNPDYFQELRSVLAGDAAEPDRHVSVHIVPESQLNLESAAMIEEMRRIAGDPDLHRQTARSSAAGREPTP